MAGSNSAVMVGAWSLRVWQMCFLVVGLPGLLLAALVWLGAFAGGGESYALMTAIRDAGRVYSFAGLETSGRIDLGGCAAGA
jgi:hypothetical protein